MSGKRKRDEGAQEEEHEDDLDGAVEEADMEEHEDVSDSDEESRIAEARREAVMRRLEILDRAPFQRLNERRMYLDEDGRLAIFSSRQTPLSPLLEVAATPSGAQAPARKNTPEPSTGFYLLRRNAGDQLIRIPEFAAGKAKVTLRSSS